MGESKHTKGPLVVPSRDLTGHCGFAIMDRDDRGIGLAYATDEVLAGYGKTKDARSRSPEGQAEAWANAQLWAAAPKMFEALTVLVALVEMDDSFNDPANEPDSYAALVNARSALSRATGGEG